MCGIVGCILNEDAKVAPILLGCIKNLEYRGYDSIGIATLDKGINIKKDKGKIDEVDERLNFKNMEGNCGIAHTRWASAGKPTSENAHPHLDDSESIAVVHNGTLENYLELKDELIRKGHKFISTTDTEIIPHLIREFMDEGFDLESSVRKCTSKLRGSYAIVAMSKDEEGKLIATRKDSPLIVAYGETGYFISSDTPAVLDYARDVIRPKEGEIILLSENGIEIHDENGESIEWESQHIDWSPEMARKEGYDHFMIKEIHEQSNAVKNTLTQKSNIQKVIDEIGEVKRICFVACGTSYHASITGKYLIESLARIPCDVVIASEFKYAARTWDEETLVIFISQSGETYDSRMALKQARKTSKTLAIVNVEGSAMTEEAEHYIQTQAGPEIGVAATKTYIAQLTAVYLFAGLLSENDELLEMLYDVPAFIDDAVSQSEHVKDIAKRYDFADNAFYLGRGFSYPIALEGALKLKEITYIHAEGYAAGELKHGPLALIDEKVPVIVIIPPGEDHDKTMVNLHEVKARDAIILSVGAEGDKKVAENSRIMIEMDPEVNDIIAPLVYTVPLQLLSYYVTLEKGYNPDQPRNLAKVITV